MKYSEEEKRKSNLHKFKEILINKYEEPYENCFLFFIEDCDYYTKENPNIVEELIEYIENENPSWNDLYFYET